MITASLLEKFSLPISPGTLGIVLVILFLFWLVFSLILHYHWKKYASSRVHVFQMTLVYFFGSTVLWACLLAFYLMYIATSY
jgi:hypothetical protein